MKGYFRDVAAMKAMPAAKVWWGGGKKGEVMEKPAAICCPEYHLQFL